MIRTIVDLIRTAKIDLSSEKRAQADVEQILTQAGIAFEREVRLTESDYRGLHGRGRRDRAETARGEEN